MSDEAAAGGPGDDPDLAAAEYVLGTLPAAQARAMEALALSDPAVAAQIEEWQVRLAPLAALAVPRRPPPELWRRLALATGIDDVQARRRTRRAPAQGLWGSLGFWRLGTLGAAAAAAALAFLLLRPPPPAAPDFLAALSPAGAPGATFLVRIGPDGSALIVATAPPDQAPGRALQLWALPAGGTVPISLGVLPPNGRAQLRAPTSAGTQLLLSDEPEGGSPTGQPTGPVRYQGAITVGG